jgi:hypothetical protein
LPGHSDRGISGEEVSSVLGVLREMHVNPSNKGRRCAGLDYRASSQDRVHCLHK